MTTHLWKLLESEVNRKAGRFQRTVTAADMARATDLSPQVFSKWKNTPTQPKLKHLVVVRDRLHIPWSDLLDAILTDKGYLPEPPPTPLSTSLDRIISHTEPAVPQDEESTETG